MTHMIGVAAFVISLVVFLGPSTGLWAGRALDIQADKLGEIFSSGEKPPRRQAAAASGRQTPLQRLHNELGAHQPGYEKALTMEAAAKEQAGVAMQKHLPTRFKVDCQFNGSHGNDARRLPVSEELRLLHRAIEEAYPQLPVELQAVADQIVFRVEHGDSPRNDAAWGPALDHTYIYPANNFDGAQGIKANFSEAFILLLDLAPKAVKDQTEAEEGFRQYVSMVIAQVLMTAKQYHDKPVRPLALKDWGNLCRDGLCDPAALDETEQWVNYDLESRGASHPLGEYSKLSAFAARLNAYRENSHPEEFLQGQKYWLLRREYETHSLIDGDIIQRAKAAAYSGTMLDYRLIGQYELPRIVNELAILNDMLEDQNRYPRTQEIEVNVAARTFMANVRDWERQWSEYAGILDSIKAQALYMDGVEQRYYAELGRFYVLVADTWQP
ncbi:MAG: hypothetical protein HY547_04525 [Elusimicrobia bacterium]|nr:hypothetical protein [Elusimicrobiota bacterium]